MKKIRVTYTLVVDITPTEDDIDQEQRAIDMVCDEPMAYVGGNNVTVTAEWAEVDE
jgi:hypothetical protein